MLAKDALDFMRKNALLIGEFDKTDNGLTWATLVRTEWNLFKGNVYKLNKGGGEGKENFRIYWVHYNTDKTYWTTLGTDAQLMFTPRMSGCTFGIGLPASDGTVVVSHSNIHEGTGIDEIELVDKALETPKLSFEKTIELTNLRRELVRNFQLKNIVDAFGDDTRILHKLDMANPQYAAAAGIGITTFGLYDAKEGWQFYFQARDKDNQVTGVYEIG